jgi:site-specific DNA-methyltransferase (cytosine-N4-specific)
VAQRNAFTLQRTVRPVTTSARASDPTTAAPSRQTSCIPNTESNSLYLRLAKLVGLERHPARFPAALPEFFIKFLTSEGDLVVDIFAGSNTTGRVAEQLGRRWMAMELDPSYVAGSALRFMDHLPEGEVLATFARLSAGSEGATVDLSGPRTLFDRPEVSTRLTTGCSGRSAARPAAEPERWAHRGEQ